MSSLSQPERENVSNPRIISLEKECKYCYNIAKGRYVISPNKLTQRFYCDVCIERHDIEGAGRQKLFARPLARTDRSIGQIIPAIKRGAR